MEDRTQLQNDETIEADPNFSEAPLVNSLSNERKLKKDVSTRKPKTKKSERLTSMVYNSTDIKEDGFKLCYENKKLFKPKTLPQQTWSFDSFVPEASKKDHNLDFYNYPHKYLSVKSLGQRFISESDFRDELLGKRKSQDSDSVKLWEGWNLERIDRLREEQVESRYQEILRSVSHQKRVERKQKDLEILKLLAEGNLSQKEVARKVGCSQATVSRVIGVFRKTKTLRTRSSEECSFLFPSRFEVSEFLKTKFREQGHLYSTFKELTARIKDHFPSFKTLPQSRLTMLLKKSFGVTKMGYFSRPARISAEECKTWEAGVISLILKMVASGITIIAFDETSFLSEGFSVAALGMTGMEPRKQKRASVLGVHLILAISQHGIEAAQISTVAFKTEGICFFVNQLLARIASNPSIDLSKVCLLADNAPTHRTQQFIDLCRGKNLPVIFTLPATPRTNPAEQAFMMVKGPLRKLSWCQKGKLLTTISDQLKNLVNIPGKQLFKLSAYELLKFI